MTAPATAPHTGDDARPESTERRGAFAAVDASIAAREDAFFNHFDPVVPGVPGCVERGGAPVTLAHDSDAADGRGLTYTWLDRSPDRVDLGPWESGIATSVLKVTVGSPSDAAAIRIGTPRPEPRDPETGRRLHGTDLHAAQITAEPNLADHPTVAYLRVSFTTRALVDHIFNLADRTSDRGGDWTGPFRWADENTGASYGFTWRADETDTLDFKRRTWATAHVNERLTPASWNSEHRQRHWSIQASDAPGDPADPSKGTVADLDADLAAVAAHYRKQIAGFVRSHTAPYVAFSHVDNAFDADRDRAAGYNHPGPLRGTGIGRRMYLLAAQHLATTGRVLVGSGSQTDEAQALWARLIADPDVPTRRTRRKFYRTGETHTRWCLDYTR